MLKRLIEIWKNSVSSDKIPFSVLSGGSAPPWNILPSAFQTIMDPLIAVNSTRSQHLRGRKLQSFHSLERISCYWSTHWYHCEIVEGTPFSVTTSFKNLCNYYPYLIMNKKLYVFVILLFNLSILKDYMGVWVERRNIHGNITNYIPLHKFRVNKIQDLALLSISPSMERYR